MAEAKHELDRNWRVPRITALQSDALTIDDTLDHLLDLATLLEYVKEQEALTEVRSLTAVSGRSETVRRRSRAPESRCQDAVSGVLWALGDLALVVSGAAAGYAFRAMQDAKRAADVAKRELAATLAQIRVMTNGGMRLVPQPSDPDYDADE